MRSTGSSRLLALVLLTLVFASGCAVAGGIFKAGAWIGALGVILVFVLIAFLVTRLRR